MVLPKRSTPPRALAFHVIYKHIEPDKCEH